MRSFVPVFGVSLLVAAAAVPAATFTTSNTADAGSYGVLTAQGFSPSLAANPDPGLASGSTVYLQQFQFYKADPNVADSAGNIELVILNGAYPLLTGLTTTSAAVVGISSNVIASTTGQASGSAISFDFANLALSYGGTYAAGLFTQSGTSLTPVTISALTANYVLDTSGDADNGQYIPVTNYGGLDNYTYNADGGVSGGYYSAYSHGGDANFYATLSTTATPEPALAGALVIGGLALKRRR